MAQPVAEPVAVRGFCQHRQRSFSAASLQSAEVSHLAVGAVDVVERFTGDHRCDPDPQTSRR
jgi:hypothetical protein